MKANDVYSFAEHPPGIEKAREDGPGRETEKLCSRIGKRGQHTLLSPFAAFHSLIQVPYRRENFLHCTRRFPIGG